MGTRETLSARISPIVDLEMESDGRTCFKVAIESKPDETHHVIDLF